ncbi:hypothetical protein [Halosimplex marinum]|uniref:hypothetical protein n=1 Tax=Halosimplex marinum TaxID=3396620 RepID=UPI003F57F464
MEAESDLQLGLTQGVTDPKKAKMDYRIRRALQELAVKRWQALQVLKKNLDEDYRSPELMDLPKEAGGTVLTDHPAINSAIDKLVEKEYFEPTEESSDIVQLTEKGERWLNEDSDIENEYNLDTDLSLS